MYLMGKNENTLYSLYEFVPNYFIFLRMHPGSVKKQCILSQEI